MVRITAEPEGDPTERLNLDDYNSDDFNEYLSDNMETTLPTITEAQATTKEDLPAPLPPAVTITVQLDEQHPAEDLNECHRQLNQKRAFRRQRLANTLQEQQGDNYDYSNCDLRRCAQRHHLKKKGTGGSRGIQPFFQLPHPAKGFRILQEAQAGSHQYLSSG